MSETAKVSGAELKGKVAFVTGGASGLGLRTFRQLARRGARVYVADCNEEKGREVVDSFISTHPSLADHVVFFKIDLGTIASARAGAEIFLKREDRLDILVNNAGLISKTYELSPDGIVDTMSTNYFGHYVLTTTLLPLLKHTASEPESDVRIVSVASDGYTLLPADIRLSTLDDLNTKMGGDAFNHQVQRYSLSKLTLILFTRALQARLTAESIPITAIVLHPGAVATEGVYARIAQFPRPIAWLVSFLIWLTFATPERGAVPIVFAACDPAVRADVTRYCGAYLAPDPRSAEGVKVVELAGAAANTQLGEDLWALSEKTVSEKLAATAL